MKRIVILLPLAIFLAFVVAAIWRLASPPSTDIQSKLIGQVIPERTLPPALPGGAPMTLRADGKPRLVNFFASWCAPCIGEVPFMLDMKARGVRIDGIAVRDRPSDAADFLARLGNPYARTGADRDSQVQLLFGASGVPETFVVDGAGVVRFQHIGPITAADAADLERRVQELGR